MPPYRKKLFAACYAVLARDLDLPLVTADESLARLVPWAISLGDPPTPRTPPAYPNDR